MLNVILQDSLTYLENVASHIYEYYGEQATNYGIEKLCSACRWIAFARFNVFVSIFVLGFCS